MTAPSRRRLVWTPVGSGHVAEEGRSTGFGWSIRHADRRWILSTTGPDGTSRRSLAVARSPAEAMLLADSLRRSDDASRWRSLLTFSIPTGPMPFELRCTRLPALLLRVSDESIGVVHRGPSTRAIVMTLIDRAGLEAMGMERRLHVASASLHALELSGSLKAERGFSRPLACWPHGVAVSR